MEPATAEELLFALLETFPVRVFLPAGRRTSAHGSLAQPYVVGLGIAPHNFGFVVHRAGSGEVLNETLATLSRYGIAVKRQVELHYGRYTDRKKIEAVK